MHEHIYLCIELDEKDSALAAILSALKVRRHARREAGAVSYQEADGVFNKTITMVLVQTKEYYTVFLYPITMIPLCNTIRRVHADMDTYLSRTPATTPARKAAQFSWPISEGTDTKALVIGEFSQIISEVVIIKNNIQRFSSSVIALT